MLLFNFTWSVFLVVEGGDWTGQWPWQRSLSQDWLKWEEFWDFWSLVSVEAGLRSWNVVWMRLTVAVGIGVRFLVEGALQTLSHCREFRDRFLQNKKNSYKSFLSAINNYGSTLNYIQIHEHWTWPNKTKPILSRRECIWILTFVPWNMCDKACPSLIEILTDHVGGLKSVYKTL